MPLTAQPILTATEPLLLLTLHKAAGQRTLYLAPFSLFNAVHTLFHLGTVSNPSTSYLLIRILYHATATVYDLAIQEVELRSPGSPSGIDVMSGVFFVQKQTGWRVPSTGPVKKNEEDAGTQTEMTGWLGGMEGKEVQMIMALGENERVMFEGGVKWTSWEVFDGKI